MPPTRQSGKQSKTLIWDDTNKIWKAWDGAITTGDIEIGAVEIKDGATDAKVVVKTDGVNNALVVTQNSVPTHAVTQSGTWDIGTLTGITNDVAVTGTFWQTTQPVSGTFWQTTQPISGTVSATQSGTWNIATLTDITNSVSIKDENENQRILDTDDAVTTVNYADSDKDSVSSIVTASATLSRKVTDTYNNGGATTLVITRTTGDV